MGCLQNVRCQNVGEPPSVYQFKVKLDFGIWSEFCKKGPHKFQQSFPASNKQIKKILQAFLQM